MDGARPGRQLRDPVNNADMCASTCTARVQGERSQSAPRNPPEPALQREMRLISTFCVSKKQGSMQRLRMLTKSEEECRVWNHMAQCLIAQCLWKSTTLHILFPLRQANQLNATSVRFLTARRHQKNHSLLSSEERCAAGFSQTTSWFTCTHKHHTHTHTTRTHKC